MNVSVSLQNVCTHVNNQYKYHNYKCKLMEWLHIGYSNTMNSVASNDIVFCNDEKLLAIFRKKDDLHAA